MTDRELLELAAKAAGIEIDHWRGENPMVNDSDYDSSCYKYWNPLTDDGDALRLAVVLRLDVYHANDADMAVYVGHPQPYPDHYRICCVSEFYKDPYAATRRAIVRAAAEIGKGMK